MRVIRTTNAKRWLALALTCVAALAAVVGLLALGALTEQSRSGATPADAFNEIPELPEAFDELVSWLPDRELPREVEPSTRRLVEAAWVKSWARVDAAQRSGDRANIDVWFVAGLAGQAASTARANYPAAVVQHAHRLEVTFYSIDGSVMTLTAESDLERTLHRGPTLREVDRYDAVFLLSDGNWRLQHLTRL